MYFNTQNYLKNNYNYIAKYIFNNHNYILKKQNQSM
jgi:hypothetical protein